MKIIELATVDAFIAIDLDEADTSFGVVRAAPKILPGGAQELARSLTYSFAVLEQQRSGASAGINADTDSRDAAIAAFVEEVEPLVAAGTFLPEAARGVSRASLAGLGVVDPRSALRFDEIEGSPVPDHLAGVGAAAAAAAVTDLAGRKVAIEGFGASGPALARQVVEWGGVITAISTGAGTVSDKTGLEVGAATAAWRSAGDEMVGELGHVEPAWKIFGWPCDVLFTGSKVGALTHQGAEHVEASTVVPSGPVPVTTKAFAMLRRAGVTVVPDFVSTAGPLFAMWPHDGASAASVESLAISTITDLMGDLVGHEDGPLMAACYKAEAFLATWCETLPFGRPLAA